MTTCGGDSVAAETVVVRPYCAGGTHTGSGVVVVVGGDGGGGADGSDGTRSLCRTASVLPRRSTPTVNGRLSAAISCTRARPPGHRRHVGRAPS